MAIQTSESVGVAILKALGIEAKMVMGVSLNLQPGEIATVTIERALDSEQVGQLVKHLETYDLVKKGEPRQNPETLSARQFGSAIRRAIEQSGERAQSGKPEAGVDVMAAVRSISGGGSGC